MMKPAKLKEKLTTKIIAIITMVTSAAIKKYRHQGIGYKLLTLSCKV